MFNEISTLRTKIENHLKNLEYDQRYKFFKQRDEALLTARIFLAGNSAKKLSTLTNERLKQTHSVFIEIENTLKELIHA